MVETHISLEDAIDGIRNGGSSTELAESIVNLINKSIDKAKAECQAEIQKVKAETIEACSSCTTKMQIGEQVYRDKTGLLKWGMLLLVVSALTMPVILHFSGAAVATELWKIEYGIFGVLAAVILAYAGIHPKLSQGGITLQTNGVDNKPQ